MIRIREIPYDCIPKILFLPLGRTKVAVAVEARSKHHLGKILFDLDRNVFEVKGTSWRETQNERRL